MDADVLGQLLDEFIEHAKTRSFATEHYNWTSASREIRSTCLPVLNSLALDTTWSWDEDRDNVRDNLWWSIAGLCVGCKTDLLGHCKDPRDIDEISAMQDRFADLFQCVSYYMRCIVNWTLQQWLPKDVTRIITDDMFRYDEQDDIEARQWLTRVRGR